jgi:hypothetical protein
MRFQKRIPHEIKRERKKERNKVGPRLEGKKGNSNNSNSRRSSSRHVAITWSYTTTNEVSGRRGA